MGYLFLDGKREWVVNGRIAASHLTGSTEAMTRLQNASQRYFGRPDATHVELDPQATSLGGWTGSMNLNRNAGVHQVNAALWSVSPGFDSSDRLHVRQRSRRRPRGVSVAESQGHRLRAAGPCGREVHVELRPRAPGDGVHMFGNVELKNYWTVFANVGLFRTVQDDRATRGGPSMLQPSSHNEFIGIESDGRNVFPWAAISAATTTTWAPGTGAWASTSATVPPLRSRSRPDPTSSAPQPVAACGRLRGSVAPMLRIALRVLDPRPGGVQPADASTVLAEDVACSVMQPPVSVGHYTAFKQFARPRTFDFIPLDREPGSLTYDPVNRNTPRNRADGGATFEFDDPDFNVKSLRLNLISTGGSGAPGQRSTWSGPNSARTTPTPGSSSSSAISAARFRRRPMTS